VDIAFVDGSSADHHKLSRWEVAGRRSRQIEQSHLLEDAPQKPDQWPSPKQMNKEDSFGSGGLLSLFLYTYTQDPRRDAFGCNISRGIMCARAKTSVAIVFMLIKLSYV